MRIRDIIKRLLTRSTDVNAKIAKDKDDATPMDLRKAECPYCKKALDKIPNRKIKCPHCGEFMYVRTRPKDNARVVVVKAEADKIEEEWARIHDHDRFFARGPSRKEKFEKERERLRKVFGKEPSERDVIWGILNKEIGEHAQPGN